jgi:GAF domain-containing protein
VNTESPGDQSKREPDRFSHGPTIDPPSSPNLAPVAFDVALERFDESRQSWGSQHGLFDFTTAPLTDSDPDRALTNLVHQARISGRAAGASVSVPADEGTVSVTVAEGTHMAWHDARIPIDGSIAGAALIAGTPIHITDPTADTRIAEGVAVSGNIGPTLAMPIHDDTGPRGVLVISRAARAEPFDKADEELIGAFASRTALALHLAGARRDIEQLRLIEDRLRTAEQLREAVISRLFVAGMSIRAVLPRVTDAVANQTFTNHINEIDAIITEIRMRRFAPPSDGGP